MKLHLAFEFHKTLLRNRSALVGHNIQVTLHAYLGHFPDAVCGDPPLVLFLAMHRCFSNQAMD